MLDWGQTIATITSILAVGLGLLAYLTRQFNRIGDQLSSLDVRLKNVENEQVRNQERFNHIDERFDRIELRLDRMDERFVRIERAS